MPGLDQQEGTVYTVEERVSCYGANRKSRQHTVYLLSILYISFSPAREGEGRAK